MRLHTAEFDYNADLDFTSTLALSLNGAVINDVSGNAASLTLPSPGATYSISDDQNIIIDARPQFNGIVKNDSRSR
jgi:hypothetical protein